MEEDRDTDSADAFLCIFYRRHHRFIRTGWVSLHCSYRCIYPRCPFISLWRMAVAFQKRVLYGPVMHPNGFFSACLIARDTQNVCFPALIPDNMKQEFLYAYLPIC